MDKVALFLVPVITGGAILTATAKVFLGWGTHHRGRDLSQEAAEEEDPETESERPATPVVMVVPAALLTVAGLGLGLVPHLSAAAHTVAGRFQDGAAYAEAVLVPSPPPSLPRGEPPKPLAPSSLVLGALTTAGAVGVAAASMR